MKQKFWAMYYELVRCKYYFQICRRESIIIERIIGISAALISSASVASWFIWNEFAVAWALIIALSNILHIIKPFLPYEKQISAINYMLPDLKDLITDVEHYYNSISNVSDEDIANHIKLFRQTYNKLESKFIENIVYTSNPRTNQKARLMIEQEFKYKQ